MYNRENRKSTDILVTSSFNEPLFFGKIAKKSTAKIKIEYFSETERLVMPLFLEGCL